jgi:hypothetical protein
MKNLFTLSALAAVLVASTTVASAETIQVGSYATGDPAMGNGNTSVTFSPTTPGGITPYTGGAFSGFTTQNDGVSGPGTVALTGVTPTWTAAQSNTEWVSFGQTGPNTPESGMKGGVFPPNGNYYYQSTFSFSAPELLYSGYLSLLADDTVTVFLNGHQENTPTAPGGFSLCSNGVPTCQAATVVTLNGVDFNANGLDNVLTFQVTQGGSFNTGLDFTGSVSAVPEPSSLLMMGTGLIGSACALFRRMRS